MRACFSRFSFALCLVAGANAFQPAQRNSACRKIALAASTQEVEQFLDTNTRAFYEVIMKKNDDVWKKLRDSPVGVTIFAPTDEAMQNLGDKKLNQLADVRNEEALMKMGAFHAVNEPVGAEELFDSAGVIPIAGEAIPVERGITGGIFGVGGKEDGSVTVGGAKVLDSIVVGESIIHVTDALVSPTFRRGPARKHDERLVGSTN